MFDTSNFAQGLALGLGMFVCPGPKDVLILRQAISRRPPIEMIAAGVLSDALLIWLGMASHGRAEPGAGVAERCSVGRRVPHGLAWAAGRKTCGRRHFGP